MILAKHCLWFFNIAFEIFARAKPGSELAVSEYLPAYILIGDTKRNFMRQIHGLAFSLVFVVIYECYFFANTT
jgi:hypothetical protein